MNFTMEELRAMEEELDARKAAKIDELESMPPQQLLGLYNRRVTDVEAATSMEALEQAERDVEVITEAIIARMS